MKTKEIPIVIMLIAGLINCILSLNDNLDLLSFCTRLLIVLLVFYFFGVIVRIVVEINFDNLLKNGTNDKSDIENEELLENIDTKNVDNENITNESENDIKEEESDL